jgi:hypothetical protein
MEEGRALITRAATWLITRAATRHPRIDHVIEKTGRGCGTKLDEPSYMRTIQISIGEIIEAMYEELLETYGDKELALVAAQALGDDLLARIRRSGNSKREA